VGIRDFKFTVTQDHWLDFNLEIAVLVMNKCKLGQLDCAHSLLQQCNIWPIMVNKKPQKVCNYCQARRSTWSSREDCTIHRKLTLFQSLSVETAISALASKAGGRENE
jgi:hypothetical protein